MTGVSFFMVRGLTHTPRSFLELSLEGRRVSLLAKPFRWNTVRSDRL